MIPERPKRAIGGSPLISIVLGFGLALFVFAGRWSLSRIFPSIPASLGELRYWATAIVAVASVTVAVGSGGARESRVEKLVYPGLQLLFLGYMALTAVWCPNIELGGAKALELGLIAACVAAIWVAGLTGRLKWVWWGFWTSAAAMGLMLAIAALVPLLSGDAGSRLSVLGGGPNVLPRLLGLFGIALLWRSARRSRGKMGIAWSIQPVIMIVILATGSRGGAIAYAAGLAVAIAYFERRVLGPVAIVVASVGTVSIMAGGAYWDQVESRYLSGTFRDDGVYTSGRDELYWQAWALAKEAPVVGAGLAAFPSLGLGVYPHNILLETAAEGGGVGLALLCLSLGVVPLRARRMRASPSAAALMSGACLVFVAAQFTGDLFDSRALFLFVAGLAMAVPEHGHPSSERLP